MRRHWRTNGPPTHVAVAIFAASWGVKLTAEPEPEKMEELDMAPGRKTIAELAREINVVAGGDTLAASRAIMARLAEGSAS